METLNQKKIRRAVYPGSFDPCTNGHLDIIRRASEQFDEVIVGVLRNSAKTPLFSTDERVNILKEVTKDLLGVVVKSFDGLLVNFVRESEAQVIIRGLRAITDYEYELQLAQTNRVLAPNIDTMFLIAGLEFAYLSSTMIKEIAAYGEDISRFVPAVAAEAMKPKLKLLEKHVRRES